MDGLVGALLLLTPFVRATSTLFISDDIQMVLFGATTGAGEIAWLPSSRWTWHRRLPAFNGFSTTPPPARASSGGTFRRDLVDLHGRRDLPAGPHVLDATTSVGVRGVDAVGESRAENHGRRVFAISPDGSGLIPLARATSHDTTR